MKLDKTKESKTKLKEARTQLSAKVAQLEADLIAAGQRVHSAQAKINNLDSTLNSQKLKMNEFSDSIDPGTQLVKSLSLMIGTLQSDLEQKRISDQNLVKAILQGTQSEQAKGEIS